MTTAEMIETMKRGVFRYRARSGRVYHLDPEQRRVLENEPEATDHLLIGWPETESPRKRGRKWQWLAPKNLTPAD